MDGQGGSTGGEKMHTLQFENSEQYMMWAKAVLFGDASIAQRILSEGADPRLAKSLGREVKGFDSQVERAREREI
jgi:predicted NAD-dependent protein-ADP-ribosyltransferase YbiA (DUF1768 family)